MMSSGGKHASDPGAILWRAGGTGGRLTSSAIWFCFLSNVIMSAATSW